MISVHTPNGKLRNINFLYLQKEKMWWTHIVSATGISSNDCNDNSIQMICFNRSCDHRLFFKSFNITLFLYRSMVIQLIKNTPTNAGDTRDVGSIPESGRSPGVGTGNPLQYSCLENFMDKTAWWATVHGVKRSQTQLSTSEGSYRRSFGNIIRLFLLPKITFCLNHLGLLKQNTIDQMACKQ